MHLPNQKVPMVMSNSIARLITGLFLILSLWLLLFILQPLFFAIAMICLIFGIIQELQKMMPSDLRLFFLLPWYPIMPCLMLIFLHQSSDYHRLVAYIFELVFTFDTACYLAGTTYSRFATTHKIVPSISKGKSWQGFGGGLIATTLVLWYIKQHNASHLLEIMLLSLIICSIAFVGDIFESYLKRSAGIKDSGTILPGHGGLLDRFDAILFVTYFFFVYKNYLIQIL